MFSKSTAVRLNMVPKSSRCLLVLATRREDIDAKFVGTSNWFLKRSDIWRIFWERVVLKRIIAPQCSWSYQTCERLVPFRNSDNSDISDAQPAVIPNKEECLQNCQSDHTCYAFNRIKEKGTHTRFQNGLSSGIYREVILD